MKTNTLICGDTMYHLDAAYRAGAAAMREGRPFDTSNPYRDMTTSHDQFDYGHSNEAAGEHIRFGVDVIKAQQNGRCFEEDIAVPRDKYGADTTRLALCGTSNSSTRLFENIEPRNLF